ncbi:MAG: DUF885 domain-containing protein [Bacteroidia bacterium]|nr:DUF885 domain-containing protein [Bacteroidia bacterium]
MKDFYLLKTILLIVFVSPGTIISAQFHIDSIIQQYEVYLDNNKEQNKIAWPDVSDGEMISQYERFHMFNKQLDSIDYNDLDKEQAINYDILKLIFEDHLSRYELKAHYMPLNAEGGFIISMIYSTRGLNLDDSEARSDYVQKLGTTSKYIDSQINWLNKGLIENVILPRVVIENCIYLIEDLLQSEGASFFLYKPLGELPGEELANNIHLSFVRLHQFLKESYLAESRKDVGLSNTKYGKELYKQRVRYFTTLDMSPEDVFNTGQKEVKRIREEMNQIINDLEFEGSFSEFLHFLRNDPQFYARTEQELLSHAAWLSKKAEEILPRYFGHLPRLPFTVNPVPDAIAPNYTTGRYSGGSMERRKAGEYWVNTYNLPSRPLYVLPALTLHEAVPGHHLQGSLAGEMKDVPNFRRNYYISAYGEGWGLYSEFLGKEAGIYTSLYEEFGRLTYEMWRACRLVVDPGMHYFGWSRQQALDFMKENTSLSLHEINTEINRYIGWPGQAVSYKIGELKIRELRNKTEQALGKKFDIRAFHDLVLAQGSIPLNTLERMVDSFIKDKLIEDEKN